MWEGAILDLLGAQSGKLVDCMGQERGGSEVEDDVVRASYDAARLLSKRQIMDVFPKACSLLHETTDAFAAAKVLEDFLEVNKQNAV